MPIYLYTHIFLIYVYSYKFPSSHDYDNACIFSLYCTALYIVYYPLFIFLSFFDIYNTGGHVGIADFFLRGNYDDTLTPLFRTLRSAESTFHKGWFSMDHVHLLSDEQLEDFEGLDVVWDNRFRGAIPFLPFLQPFHGVYIMKKK